MEFDEYQILHQNNYFENSKLINRSEAVPYYL